MSILIAISGWGPEAWLTRLRAAAPNLTFIDANAPFDTAAIRHAIVWKPQPGLLATLPNLVAIHNLGAGVDALLTDPTLPEVPLCRIVNPNLTARMTEYVVLTCLMHLRQVGHYNAMRAVPKWSPIDQPSADQVRVGILGFGNLGRDAAEVLLRLGFDVAGWSRSKQEMAGVANFAGSDQLDAFLTRTDILVSLLPLTPDTRGILARPLFTKLARNGRLPGPVLINAGRGGLQNEADILTCLDDGTLHSASLDVFETEPLPLDSKLWTHPKVLLLTPHAAADSTPEALVEGVLANIARAERGEAMLHVVDRTKGY